MMLGYFVWVGGFVVGNKGGIFRGFPLKGFPFFHFNGFKFGPEFLTALIGISSFFLLKTGLGYGDFHLDSFNFGPEFLAALLGVGGLGCYLGSSVSFFLLKTGLGFGNFSPQQFSGLLPGHVLYNSSLSQGSKDQVGLPFFAAPAVVVTPSADERYGNAK